MAKRRKRRNGSHKEHAGAIETGGGEARRGMAVPDVLRRLLPVDSSRWKGLLRRPQLLLVALPLVALTLIPVVWAFRMPLLPFQDLPIHLALDHVLFKFPFSESLRQYYKIQLFASPYMVQDLILYPSMLFGYRFAGAMLTSVIFCALPLSLYLCLRWTNPGREYLVLLALPFLWSKLLLKGNMNYMLGMAVLLPAYAILYRASFGTATRKLYLALGIMSAVLYLTHLVAFGVFLMCCAVVVCCVAARHDWPRVGRIVIALSPSLALLLVPALVKPFTTYKPDAAPLDIGTLVSETLRLVHVKGKFREIQPQLTNFGLKEWHVLLPAIALGSILFAGGLFDLRRRYVHFAVLVVLCLAYALCPREAGALIRPQERLLFSIIFLAPVCMGFPERLRGQPLLSHREQQIIIVVLCALTAGRMDALMWRTMAPMAGPLEDARTVLSKLPKGCSLYRLVAQSPFAGTIGFARHLDCYYVTEGDGLIGMRFEVPYMLVNFRTPPPWPTDARAVPYSVLRFYEFVFVWGDSGFVERALNQAGYSLRDRKGIVATYERQESLPGSPSDTLFVPSAFR